MMNTYPYHVSHIYLNDEVALQEPELSETGNYLVFWWKNIALGHLFVEPDNSLRGKEYLKQLIIAITPTINFYQQDKDCEETLWANWLQNQQFGAWSEWMESLLKKWDVNDLPDDVPVSVVVCTKDRAKSLEQCLKMLQALSCLPQEIIVVDNAPGDDATKNVVDKFNGVKYVKEPRKGLDIARNTGILNASLPIVAYVDDDVLVHPLWVFRVWETFQNPAVSAMTGLVIAAKLDTEAQVIFEKHWSPNKGFVEKVFDRSFLETRLVEPPPVWEIGAGANMAFRKTIFEQCGYFNELLDVGAAGCSGDSEMWFRILANYYPVFYNPRAIVYHEHRKDIKGLKKQIFYYMRGHTVAALVQQVQLPESSYKKRIFQRFPKSFAVHIAKGFLGYHFNLKTTWPEIKGVLSGVIFYYRNKKRIHSN